MHTYSPDSLASNRHPGNHATPSGKLSASVGICAYNEEATIGSHLQSLQRQELNRVEVVQIMVVSSACRDRTNEIVERLRQEDDRIELIQQPERRGKASAVNLFLQEARAGTCILVSADTVLAPRTIEHLCLPFLDERVGMTGGHAIPVNDPSTFMGFASHLIWHLAHEVSLTAPKLGELIAFRNIVDRIPEDTAVDEASIEAVVTQKGYSLRYVPEAIIYNRGPDTVSDYIKQRRRIYAGHLDLKKTSEYKVSTMSSPKLLRLVSRSIRPSWRSIFWTPGAMMLEFYARLLGAYDFRIRRRKPYIWDIATSTKVAFKDDPSIAGDSAVQDI